MSLGSLHQSHLPISPTRVAIGPEQQRATQPQSTEPKEIEPRILFLDSANNFSFFDSLFGANRDRVTIAQERQPTLDFLATSSAHQPLLVILTNCSRVEMDSLEILKLTESHMFVRVLQVTQKWIESPSSNLEICLPFRNPGLQIRSFQIPEDESKLTWEISEFFSQAEILKTTIGRLLRFSSLTDREMRVAQYVTRGYPNKKISNVESVSEKTIEKWRKEMYEKLEVSCAAELVSLVTLRNFLRWPANVGFPH